ncbi:hypothetical protein [Lusitaniella coriacea]|uniref:hypothetical protein n=1 Tax=Lusitaniella coriacea TaxID=1983105 RepID=UPI003CEB3CC6
MKVQYLTTIATVTLLSLGLTVGCTNPCASKEVAPSDATTETEVNPCAAKEGNPCAAKEGNPCAGKEGNPCAAKEGNPCAGKEGNPCAGKE